MAQQGDAGDADVAGNNVLDIGVREAVLALEGTTIEDFQVPLPGDLKDLGVTLASVYQRLGRT